MSDASQPKPGSLWARIMGLSEETPSASAEPAAGEAPTSAEPRTEHSADVELVDDDAVSFEPPAEMGGDSPTLKLANVLPPVPEFARNPLDSVEDRLVAPPEFEADDSAELPLTEAGAQPAALSVETIPATFPPCASCGAARQIGAAYCHDCGFLFSELEAPLASPIAADAVAGDNHASGNGAVRSSESPAPSVRIKDRYLLGKLQSEKLGVKRFRGLDVASEPPTPVVVIQSPAAEPIPVAEAIPIDDELLPAFDATPAHLAETVPLVSIEPAMNWPAPAWEKDRLEHLNLAALPKAIDDFTEDGIKTLILEVPQGKSLWDAWDDADDAATRYGWLKEIAETLDAVHKANAIFECLSPDQLVIDADGHVRVTDLGDLLPLPAPHDVPIRGTHFTAPELIASPQTADERASLYVIGALLYSLEYLHHGLEDKDFESQYEPRQITDRFPDVHPLLPRLLNKTFVKNVGSRFPSDEASRKDPTGFQELIQTLSNCQRVFDSVRLDISAWTTTGMIRTGNEDAFAFLHGVDARQDDLHEYALALLCDGMGGYEAGEVAAAIAIAEMKKFFLAQPMFAGLAGKEPFPGPIDVDAAKKIFEAGIRHANKEVFTASRTPGKGKRGMGCTAEAVYIDSRHLIVSHVGDSRVYHLSGGRLVQLTRDQTLVNRLVELGQITAEEAEDHPRKNELQQAVGGQPDVVPGVYHSRLKRGDWVLVCSDGLSNHISHKELEQMLTREASNSAEEAARRLLNLVNLRGATDNATIVVVRAT